MPITSLSCGSSISGTSLVTKINELITQINSLETDISTIETDISTIETDIDALLSPAWIAVAGADLNSSWDLPSEITPADTTSEGLRYRKFGDIVQFAGHAYKVVNSGFTLFTLPVGYRPTVERLLPIYCELDATAFLYIKTSGEVRVEYKSAYTFPVDNQFFHSFDNVSFKI